MIAAHRTTVVVITMNRCAGLLDALDRLATVSGAPPVIVVDNGSTDGTVAAVRRRHPEVTILDLGSNEGAAGRNRGVEAATTPYVAFSDDDSWWGPGALDRAAAVFDSCPQLGLLAARVEVGAERRLDPTCTAMAHSPLPAAPTLPGPRILGFVACGTVVRRRAFLDAGGFPAHYGVGGEEAPLALELAARGWDLAYVEDVVAHHHPSPVRDPARRRRRVVRNDLWTAWSHLDARTAVARTADAARAAAADATVRCGLADALTGLPGALRRRRPAPPVVCSWHRLLEQSAR